MEADALYRAHLERYAASLAAASGNPSLGLGATSSLSPYTMLAAGYPPSALGLVPPSPIIQPTLPNPMSSSASSSLNLATLPSKVTSAPLVSNHNEVSVATSEPTPTINSANQKLANEVTTTTSTSVLQQRLSTPIESLKYKDTSGLKGVPNTSTSSPAVFSALPSNGGERAKEGSEHRKDKKKNKSGTSNKGKPTGNGNCVYDI